MISTLGTIIILKNYLFYIIEKDVFETCFCLIYSMLSLMQKFLIITRFKFFSLALNMEQLEVLTHVTRHIIYLIIHLYLSFSLDFFCPLEKWS